jgi:hypothetical protein|tara:strand:- start:130 stop:294 length:165 start_codon:yes stop_codon:yes gene_type:complete
MARKKGDERKSSTSEYTSSHSPVRPASSTLLVGSAATSSLMVTRFSWGVWVGED